MKFIVLLIILATSLLSSAKEVTFQTQSIKVGKKTVLVEIAKAAKQRSQGLMFRTKLDAGKGMLFIFPKQKLRSFWMKNTFIPLSLGFFDKTKKRRKFAKSANLAHWYFGTGCIVPIGTFESSGDLFDRFRSR